jgi:fibronectin type 3 domain-containing protein
MLKRTFAQSILIVVLLCLATPLYAALPWLHTDANLIKDPCGNTVVLRGLDTIDIGSAQTWYGGVTALIDRVTSKTNPEANSPGWYPRVIRLAIYPQDDPGTSGPWYWEPNPDNYYNNLLRPVVNYCKTKDMYAIVDWHYVGQNTYDKRTQTAAFWSYMAPKFANDSHVIFELFNEPLNTSGGSATANWATLKPDMQNWINLIRAIAPNNLILVGGPSWSQQIGPSATSPFTGDNLVMVVHIYPGHWLVYGQSTYTSQVNQAITRYPVFATEWGFWSTTDTLLNGTITNYGQPLMDYYEGLKISNSAWVTHHTWTPPMFDANGFTSTPSRWALRVGETEMGGFVKDTLYLKRNSDQPVDGDTTPPEAPTGLTATPSTGTITLNWDDNPESDLYGYDIYRSTTSGGQTTRLNLVRSKTSSYTDTNVAGTRTYYYVVTAVDTNFNTSADSIEVSATVPADSTPPAIPSGLSATTSNATVSLDWNNNTEPDFNGYNIYRSTVSGGPYTRLNATPFINSDYIDNSVVNGTRYYYVVTSTDTSLNESANSSQVSAVPHIDLPVQIIGSWVTGTTHAKETGSNRALVFVVHAEHALTGVSLSSVTYGGRTMTKVLDANVAGSSNRDYVAAYILNDANITAATTTTFSPSWSTAPTAVAYTSVFLANVNQSTLTGATASATGTTATITTAALANSAGDMVIDAATCGNSGSYTLNNGFTEGNDQAIANTATGVTGSKAAAGSSETPSATFTGTMNRQALIGFVVKFAPNVAPEAPAALTASPAMGTVVLNWNDNSEFDLLGYNVYRSSISGSGYVKQNSSLLTASDYTDVNVSAETIYYYVVTAVDTSGLESVYSSEVSASPATPAIGTGAILRQWWLDIPGSEVANLTDSQNYPYNPSGRQLITKLEGPVDWNNDYGTLLQGYLNPVTSGNYTFWVASDASSELYLSTDNNLYNIQLIGYVSGFTGSHEWYKYPSQESSPISLVAGQKYFIMAVHKASTGNDNIAVAWQGPGISQQVIDGIYLSPYGLQFVDFAGFAGQWNRTDCDASNDWCSANDFNRDGAVDIIDIAAFAENWLTGIASGTE